MNIRNILTGTAAFMCASVFVAAQGQNPATQPQTPARPPAETQTTPRTPTNQSAAVAMEGCLYREADVPGRTPNVAEKAGVLEDYILADARMAGQNSGAQGLATGRMYKVESIPDERLKALVGKRVEVTGRIDAEGSGQGRAGGGAQANRNPASPDAINLPEFEATAIREVTGGAACPAKPAAAPVTPAR